MQVRAKKSKLAHADTDGAATRARNWWPAGVLAVTLGIVSILLFMRVAETDVELEMAVSELAFTLAREQVLTGAIPVSALGIAGARAIELPRESSAGEPGARLRPGELSAVRLSVSATRGNSSEMTVAPVVLPAGTRVTLSQTQPPHGYRLSITAPEAGITFLASVNGVITLSEAGAAPTELVVSSPKPITVQGASEPLDIDLTLTTTARQALLSPQLAVRDLAFSRIDQFVDGSHSVVNQVSTVLAGTLFFESLNGTQRRLRAGEQLRFAQSSGQIRVLRPDDSQITVQYQGRVRGMTTGSGEGHRSLMPTYLEWLRARHGLSLLWGSALYLFGLAASFLRWWGVRI